MLPSTSSLAVNVPASRIKEFCQHPHYSVVSIRTRLYPFSSYGEAAHTRRHLFLVFVGGGLVISVSVVRKPSKPVEPARYRLCFFASGRTLFCRAVRSFRCNRSLTAGRDVFAVEVSSDTVTRPASPSYFCFFVRLCSRILLGRFWLAPHVVSGDCRRWQRRCW